MAIRRMTTVLTLLFVLASALSLRADVRADEKTHVELAGVLGKVMNFFGGKPAKEGVTTGIAVKGDRKLTMSDATGRIIDLSEEKVYDLDLKRKSYKVTTFADLRRRMEEAQNSQENGQPRCVCTVTRL